MPTLEERISELEAQINALRQYKLPRFWTAQFVSDETPAANESATWDGSILKWRPSNPPLRVSAIVTVNNSVTLTDVTGLGFTLAANEVWAFDCCLLYNTGATPDIKFAWTRPSGCTMNYIVWKPDTASADDMTFTTDETSTITAGGSASDICIKLSGVIVNGATAGSLQLQFAQNTQTASDTSVLPNSYLWPRRISP